MSRPTSTRIACDPQATAEFLRALAHPMRLQILCRLLDGEVAVAGFESEMGLKQPSLSQQLGLLREAGLVTTRREAKSIFYSLVDDKVRVVLDALQVAFATASGKRRREQPTKQPAPVAESFLPAPRVPRPAGTPAHRPQGGECGVFSVAGWGLEARR